MDAARSRKVSAGVGAAAVGLAALWLGPGAAPHVPPLARALGVPLRLERLPGVALTFDDGPDPHGTPAVLDELERAGAKATFFLVGEQARRHPDLVGEIVARGHEPAIHGYRHRSQLRCTPRAFAEDLARAIDLLGELCGGALRLYRPPYGAFSLGGLIEVRRRGLQPLLWSRWGRDFRASTGAPRVAELVCQKLSAGDVVLLHDCDRYCDAHAWRQTVQALPWIVETIERLGLQALTVSDHA
jgi:peptidoglycan/xylan/chitin deacetylase (PgdA/CDA1 family)